MKTVMITRKIELRFNSSNNEERNQFYADVKRWQKICYKGANHISSNLFFMLNQSDLTYLNEKAKKMIADANFFNEMTEEDRQIYFAKENKEIYKIMTDNEKEMVIGSFQNAFYQVLSKKYLSECPSAILSALNQRVLKTFKENRPLYIQGEKSIPSYKSTIPIPIPAANIINVRHHNYNGKDTRDFAFTLFGKPLRTNFGIDKSGNYKMLAKAFSSWFLPDWIWNMEGELSNIIVHLEHLRSSFSLNGHSFNIEAKYDGSTIFHYNISTEHDGKEIFFKMKEAKEQVKDKDGNNVVDENGKKVKRKIFKIVSNMKLADSSIAIEKDQYQDKDGGDKKNITRVFLLAVLEIEKESPVLDEDNIAYATLSPEQPITVKIGNSEILIGTQDDFTYRRQGIQGSFRRNQRDMKGVAGGHGRKKKLKSLEQYHKYENDVVTDKLHNYSRQLIKICLDNQCKYLHLQTRSFSKEELEEMKMIVRNWTPAVLINFIKYKASMVTIEVVEGELVTGH